MLFQKPHKSILLQMQFEVICVREGTEQYIPMVSKTEVKGSRLGTTRTYDVQMCDQFFRY